MSLYSLPSLNDVDKASQLIANKIKKTPVETSATLSKIATASLSVRSEKFDSATQTKVELFFKCENFQRTGSFKFRGASHFLANLPNYELKKGVVAYSTGNHAQAVAHAAQLASQERNIPIPTYVVVPENCSDTKINSARRYCATVFLSGTDPEARVKLAKQIQHTTGAVLVPPADHRDIALGQATLVQEFLQQTKDMGHSLDALIVPSGGGGLLVGAAAVCKPYRIIVFGAEPECGGPGLSAAKQRGTRTTHMDQGTSTVADGLRSLTGEANWEIIKETENVEDIFTVTEAEIKDTLRMAIKNLGFVIEPSAAVPLAVALFSTKFHARMTAEQKMHLKVGIVLTGCNIGEGQLMRILPNQS
ncbi:tryptophan synthase beta subunit-like PLP-dependent enzyme [Delitschia confertaspora ATCC 74209]|uniref:Tryptophan synthase beta subunit-like PLP-dependent enzyme n=1 Tax=Delitschia confertaspora ATCC 74209 TaxID=1513339 RepID=A0A9P4JCU1_9PLEO|nr:tryptophan synthase beta subunit-like PLP-dependent enzyme [Delitschia confertaspora ATCC 74209]